MTVDVPVRRLDDLVLTLTVGDDRANHFNEGGAGRFNCDARTDRSGRVLHDAEDVAVALRETCFRYSESSDEREEPVSMKRPLKLPVPVRRPALLCG